MAFAGRRARTALGAALTVASLGTALFGVGTAGATVRDVALYVQDGASGGSCSSPETACGSVSAAVALAQTTYIGDDVTIHIGRGVYTGDDTVLVGTSTPGPASLTIEGAGATTTTLYARHQGRIFIVLDAGFPVTIERMTISNGAIPATTPTAIGGGVVVSRSDSVDLSNDAFVTDEATTAGGGVFAYDSDLTLSGDTFSSDHAMAGGGVYSASGQTALYDDTFAYDTATEAGGGVAIDMTTQPVLVGNSTFATDSALGGGALSLEDVEVAYAVADTFATDTAVAGGAIFTDSSEAQVLGSILSNASCTATGTGTVIGLFDVENDHSCAFPDFLPNVYTSPFINLGRLAANTSTGPETMAIGPTSSAFEALYTCPFATDERGDPRPGVPGQYCDAGAYEYQQRAASTVTCPAGVSSCDIATSKPGRTASATAGNVTVKSTGRGTIGVDSYRADPVHPLTASGTGSFFGISASTGNALKSVLVKDCGVRSGATVEWWDGKAWEHLSGTKTTFTTTGTKTCVSLNLSPVSTPSLSTLARLSRTSRFGSVVFGVSGVTTAAATASSTHAGAVSAPAVPAGGVAAFDAKTVRSLAQREPMPKLSSASAPASASASKWAHVFLHAPRGAKR